MNSRWSPAVALAFALGMLLVLPTARTVAHVELVDSSPAAGAQLDAAPTEVVLVFDGEVSDDSSFTVADEAGRIVGSGELDLYVAERNVLRGEVSVVEPGVYRVAWTATDAGDGDTASGEFTFRYGDGRDSATPAPGGGGTRPDTAVGASAGQPLFTVGVALVVAATAAAAAQAVVRRLGTRAPPGR